MKTYLGMTEAGWFWLAYFGACFAVVAVVAG